MSLLWTYGVSKDTSQHMPALPGGSPGSTPHLGCVARTPAARCTRSSADKAPPSSGTSRCQGTSGSGLHRNAPASPSTFLQLPRWPDSVSDLSSGTTLAAPESTTTSGVLHTRSLAQEKVQVPGRRAGMGPSALSELGMAGSCLDPRSSTGHSNYCQRGEKASRFKDQL